MPIRVGRLGAWQTIWPTTNWQVMPNTIAEGVVRRRDRSLLRQRHEAVDHRSDACAERSSPEARSGLGSLGQGRASAAADAATGLAGSTRVGPASSCSVSRSAAASSCSGLRCSSGTASRCSGSVSWRSCCRRSSISRSCATRWRPASRSLPASCARGPRRRSGRCVYAMLYLLQFGWPAFAGTAAGAIFFVFTRRAAVCRPMPARSTPIGVRSFLRASSSSRSASGSCARSRC